ncbi:MAG: lysylphosphatidylglycerol synthase domain-containing protein, partial [candidate division WOR-3 bacterium]|nr:lysylphosphatidylglycerol synthase domain-containing protein [candidate division WOR-3 bacterium]
MQALDMRLVKRMLRIFLVISIISITLLLVFTTTKDTLPSLKRLNPSYLILALVAVLFYIWFETLWLRILVWSVSGWMSLSGALEFILGGSFLTLVPFGIAGVPLQMYILHRENKLSIGESGSVLLVRSLLITLLLPIVLPVVYIYYSTILQQGFVVNIARYLLIAVGLG